MVFHMKGIDIKTIDGSRGVGEKHGRLVDIPVFNWSSLFFLITLSLNIICYS